MGYGCRRPVIRMRGRLAWAARLLVLGPVSGCLSGPAPLEPTETTGSTSASESSLLERARWAQDRLETTPIRLQGRVGDAQGHPVVGVSVRLHGQGTTAVQTDENGNFGLDSPVRRNAMLVLEHPQYYPEWIPAHLLQPAHVQQLNLERVRLVKREPGRARLTFAGDAMFGRRFLDGDGDGLKGGAGDLLRLDDVQSTTAALFRYMQGYLHSDDHTCINLETPVLAAPRVPHPAKRFVFFTYAPSVFALGPAGVDSVSLGNNHVCDYLGQGVRETIEHLEDAQMAWFGAGHNLQDARARVLSASIQGVDVVLQGFSNLSGSQYEKPELSLIAQDPDKAGALACHVSELRHFLETYGPTADFTIPVLHGGTEYAPTQSDAMLDDIETAVQAGADLVVAHHPHVVQGIWTYKAQGREVLVLGSLGNFIFDQKVFETKHAYLAVVDLYKSNGGTQLERLALIPYRLDDYVPRPLSGVSFHALARRVGHLSSEAKMPARAGWSPTRVKTESGRFVVETAETADVLGETTRVLQLETGQGMSAPLALRAIPDEDAMRTPALGPIRTLSSSRPASCELGRDLLLGLGRFEDGDVDDEVLEGDAWSWSEYRFVQGIDVYRGVGAAAMVRSDTQQSRVNMQMRSTVTLQPQRAYTMYGWAKGRRASRFELGLRWRQSQGPEQVWQNIAVTPGNQRWTPFAASVQSPEFATGVKVYLRLYPSAVQGQGQVLLDELALIDWSDERVELGPDATLLDPGNGWEYLRCQSDAERLVVSVTHGVEAASQDAGD